MYLVHIRHDTGPTLYAVPASPHVHDLNVKAYNFLNVYVLRLSVYSVSFWEAFDGFGWLVVLRLNVPVNNFSVMSGRSHRFLGN